MTAVRMPRAPQEERVRLLAIELVGLQEEVEELASDDMAGAITGPVRRSRLRRIVERLRGARSRLTATIEEDRA